MVINTLKLILEENIGVEDFDVEDREFVGLFIVLGGGVLNRHHRNRFR